MVFKSASEFEDEAPGRFFGMFQSHFRGVLLLVFRLHTRFLFSLFPLMPGAGTLSHCTHIGPKFCIYTASAIRMRNTKE